MKAILRYILFWIALPLTVIIFKIMNRVEIIGKENLPPRSKRYRILFPADHHTLIDSLLIGLGTTSFWDFFFHQKRISWNAPDRKNFLDHGFKKFFFGLLKNIPTDRNLKTQKAIDNQIDSYCEVLKENNLTLFANGSRTPDGPITECKAGIAMTILRSNPNYIIPITLIGIRAIMPIKVGFHISKIRSGHRGKMIIGKPLDFSNIISAEMDEKEKIELICAKVQEAIAKNYHQ